MLPAGLTMSGLGLLALGVGLVAAGLAVLYRGRRPFRPRPLHLATDGPARRRMSEPTRVVIGVVLLLGGYHAGAWAFPPSDTIVQLPRRWWWAWALGGAALIPASLGLDRFERKRFGPGDGEG